MKIITKKLNAVEVVILQPSDPISSRISREEIICRFIKDNGGKVPEWFNTTDRKFSKEEKNSYMKYRARIKSEKQTKVKNIPIKIKDCTIEIQLENKNQKIKVLVSERVTR